MERQTNIWYSKNPFAMTRLAYEIEEVNKFLKIRT